MKTRPRELPIPGPAVEDEQSIELARIWIAKGGQHVSLATEIWEDPASWGIMLVDLARHVSIAYQQTTRMTSESALARVKEGFDAEWNSGSEESN